MMCDGSSIDQRNPRHGRVDTPVDKWKSHGSERTVTSVSTATEDGLIVSSNKQWNSEQSDDLHQRVKASFHSLKNNLDNTSIASIGIPQEVLICNSKEVPIICQDEATIHEHVESLKLLAMHYKSRAASNEDLLDSLKDEVERTKLFVEELVNERTRLLRSIEDIEDENNSKMKQSSIFRILLTVSLFFYLCGGSEQFLLISVGIYVLVDCVVSAI